MYLPTLNEIAQSRINTEVFRGRNHNMRIIHGEWYDEQNLCASYYPLFSQRNKRGIINQLTAPQGMLAKDALMYIDGSQLIYNGEVVRGITLSTDAKLPPKQMVSMGAYAVIFPDKVYFNTADQTDYGSLEAEYSAPKTTTVSVQMCRVDGSAFEVKDIGDEPPTNPANGQYWIDTSADVHVLKQYSEAQGMWIENISTYVRIGAFGVGANFSVDDGVRISGLTGNEQLTALNNDNVIMTKGDDYIVITGILDNVHTQTGGLKVTRECPDMDFVTESNNRIWGCTFLEKNCI
jgi:hypothetical protein